MKLRRITYQEALTSSSIFTRDVYPILLSCSSIASSKPVNALIDCLRAQVLASPQLLPLSRTRNVHDNVRTHSVHSNAQMPPSHSPYDTVVECWAAALTTVASPERMFKCMYEQRGPMNTVQLLRGISLDEQISSFENITATEMQELSNCSRPCDHNARTCMILIDESLKCHSKGSNADISHDFLYRSIYVSHLQKVFNVFAKVCYVTHALVTCV